VSPDATPMKGIKRSPSAHDRPPGAVPGFRPTRKVREGNVFDLHSNISYADLRNILDSSWWQIEHGRSLVRRVQ
jgi:hypothetical protein